jgi:hypothetical protein
VEVRRIRDTGGGMAKHRCIGLERWRRGGAGIRGAVDQSHGVSESRRQRGGRLVRNDDDLEVRSVWMPAGQ